MLIDVDPLTGAVETMHYDPFTGLMTTTCAMNVDAILDANQAVYNDHSKPWRKAGDFWHVASVPLVTFWAWLEEFNRGKPMEDKLHSPFYPNKEWERFCWARLNSSEYRKLRTAPVTV